MYDYKTIKKKLKSNHKYFWYLVNANKYILIAKGKTRREAKENVYNKIKKNLEGYNLVFIYLSFHSGDKFGQGSQIAANISFHQVKPNLKIRQTDEIQAGSIWFKENYLEVFGWKYEYLKKLVELLFSKKKKLSVMGLSYYSRMIK